MPSIGGCLNLRGKYWRQFCDDIVSENIRIRPSTRIRNVIGLKNFHSGERIQNFPDFACEFAVCVWTIAVSGKKKLRIQKYPDTCGRGLTRRSQLNSSFKDRTRCHPFEVLKGANDLSAVDWLSQTQVKIHVWVFFSVVEIRIKHTSLCNKDIYAM